MARKHWKWIAVPLLAMAGGCGMIERKEAEIRFADDPLLVSMEVVGVGGDFALFYAGHDKPEVPVRVQAGDSVGFTREDDGRIKAVAGPFRMDMDPAAHAAIWRRMSTIDE